MEPEPTTRSTSLIRFEINRFQDLSPTSQAALVRYLTAWTQRRAHDHPTAFQRLLRIIADHKHVPAVDTQAHLTDALIWSLEQGYTALWYNPSPIAGVLSEDLDRATDIRLTITVAGRVRMLASNAQDTAPGEETAP